MKKSNLMTFVISITLMLTMMITSSCKKEEPKIFGCTDPTSSNYNPSATDDNGTCRYEGDATFWYNTSGTDALVTVDGQTRYITAYYPDYNPSCGSDGCANFTLEVGTYSYHASSTWSTWTGNITITKKGCSKMLLH